MLFLRQKTKKRKAWKGPIASDSIKFWSTGVGVSVGRRSHPPRLSPAVTDQAARLPAGVRADASLAAEPCSGSIICCRVRFQSHVYSRHPPEAEKLHNHLSVKHRRPEAADSRRSAT